MDRRTIQIGEQMKVVVEGLSKELGLKDSEMYEYNLFEDLDYIKDQANLIEAKTEDIVPILKLSIITGTIDQNGKWIIMPSTETENGILFNHLDLQQIPGGLIIYTRNQNIKRMAYSKLIKMYFLATKSSEIPKHYFAIVK
jgi:hypothetical protein